MKHKNMKHYKRIFKLLKDFFRLRFILKYVQTNFYKHFKNIISIVEKENLKVPFWKLFLQENILNLHPHFLKFFNGY